MPFQKGNKLAAKRKKKLVVKIKGTSKDLKRKAEREAGAWPKSVFQAGAGLELYPYLAYVNHSGDTGKCQGRPHTMDSTTEDD